VKRVLVVNPFGIGDVLFTLVMVESLRRAMPELEIGFICNERTEAIVRLDPSIDRTFVFNRDLFRRLWRKGPLFFAGKLRRLLGTVREFGYDTLIDVSLGREYAFFGWWLGIRDRIGFDYRGRGTFLTRRVPFRGYADRPVAEAQLDLAAALGLPAQRGAARLPLRIPEEDTAEVKRILRKAGFVPGEDLFLAVAPGGGRSWGANAVYKQWDPGRFAEAAGRFAAARRRVKVLLLGDRAERELLDRTAAALPGVPSLVLAGHPIARAAAFLRASAALLCNDGGLLHLANALGVPTVSVFGPVDERVYGPYGTDTRHAVVTEPVPCRPCYRDFRFPPCAHERRCLDLLPAEKVLRALEEII